MPDRILHSLHGWLKSQVEVKAVGDSPDRLHELAVQLKSTIFFICVITEFTFQALTIVLIQMCHKKVRQQTANTFTNQRWHSLIFSKACLRVQSLVLYLSALPPSPPLQMLFAESWKRSCVPISIKHFSIAFKLSLEIFELVQYHNKYAKTLRGNTLQLLVIVQSL